MSVFTSASPSSSSLSIDGLIVSSPTIINQAMPLANTEVAIVLPSNSARFMVKARGKAVLKLSFVSGQSGTLYVTISMGATYHDESLTPAGFVLYVQSTLAGETVEIVSWV